MTLTKSELELVNEVAKKHGATKEVAEKAFALTKRIIEAYYDIWHKVKQIINEAIAYISDRTGLTETQIALLISNNFQDTQ